MGSFPFKNLAQPEDLCWLHHLNSLLSVKGQEAQCHQCNTLSQAAGPCQLPATSLQHYYITLQVAQCLELRCQATSQTSSLVLRIPSNNSRKQKGPVQQDLLTIEDVFSGPLCSSSRSKVKQNQKKTIGSIIWVYLSPPPITLYPPPIPTKRRKAMIRFPMLSKYPQTINYSSWKAMTKERYFLISYMFLLKKGPDTCTSPSKPLARMVMLVENKVFCAGLLFFTQKRSLLLPHHYPTSLLKQGSSAGHQKLR